MVHVMTGGSTHVDLAKIEGYRGLGPVLKPSEAYPNPNPRTQYALNHTIETLQ